MTTHIPELGGDVSDLVAQLSDDYRPTPTPEPTVGGAPTYSPGELGAMLTRARASLIHIWDHGDLDRIADGARALLDAIRARQLDAAADSLVNEEIMGYSVATTTIIGSDKGPIAESHLAQLIVDTPLAAEPLKEYTLLLRGFYANADLFMRGAWMLVPGLRLPVVPIITAPETACLFSQAITNLPSYVHAIQWKMEAVHNIDHRTADPAHDNWMHLLTVRFLAREKLESLRLVDDEAVDSFLRLNLHHKYLVVADASAHREYMVLFARVYRLYGSLSLLDPHWSPAATAPSHKLLNLALDARETLLRRPVEERRRLVEQENAYRVFLRDLVKRQANKENINMFPVRPRPPPSMLHPVHHQSHRLTAAEARELLLVEEVQNIIQYIALLFQRMHDLRRQLDFATRDEAPHILATIRTLYYAKQWAERLMALATREMIRALAL
uniref:Uncharacterized protein n=1 Tax=Mycena chlorophos TaxID=658473 RepID=A0ABQ0KVL3_MYCCL|nr:predicted protein [Mycena chlorophos]